MTNTIETKQCSKCEEIKALTEYTKNKNSKDGLESNCVDCRKDIRKVYGATFERKTSSAVRTARKKAKELGVESTLTLAEVRAILSAERCSYCNKEVEEKKRTLDHVHAMQDGGGNTFDNVVMACHTCNSAKNSKPVYDFLMKHRNSEATAALLDVLAERMELSRIEALRHLEAQHTAYNEAQFMAKHYGVEAK